MALVLSSPLVPARAGPADVVRFQLEAEQTTLDQGEPLRYLLRMTNLAPMGLEGRVTFWIEPVGGEAIAFSEWSGTLYGLNTFERSGRVVTAQWFEALGEFELRAAGTFRWAASPELPLADPVGRLVFTVSPPRVVVPVFEDVTDAVGLTMTHGFISCANYSSGAAWGDIEGDGDLDLYVPQHVGGSRLWRNDGGTFTDVAASAGVLNEDRVGGAAVFADHDNDGDQDLSVVNNGPNRLYRNTGDGTFSDMTEIAGVGEDGPGTSASWGDYDADGFVDLSVTNHGRRDVCGPSPNFETYPDALYHNEGDGTFTDVTSLLPGPGGNGLGFQTTWFDYDRDQDLDLYLANDRIRLSDQPNALWRNDGAGPNGAWTFTDVSAASGTNIGINSMGIGLGDYDRDLRFDLAVSNIGPTALLRNRTAGTFVDQAAEALVDRPYQRAGVRAVTWGLVFADLNLDGWEDLYVAAGELEPADEFDEPQPNALFVNAGDGTFLDLSAPSQTDDPESSRGVALADYDADGRIDMFVVNQNGPARLYRNVTPVTGRWLEVDTIGTTGNRDGCGALVTAETGDVTQQRTVLCGSQSLGSGSDPTVHFGLGNAGVIDRLTVSWPTGTSQTVTGVPADQRITVVEP